MSEAELSIEMAATIMGAFANRGLASAATYTAPGGGPVACTVMVDRTVNDGGFDTALPSGQVLITLQIDEVGEYVEGAEIVIGSKTYEARKLIESDEESTFTAQCRLVS